MREWGAYLLMREAGVLRDNTALKKPTLRKPHAGGLISARRGNVVLENARMPPCGLGTFARAAGADGVKTRGKVWPKCWKQKEKKPRAYATLLYKAITQQHPFRSKSGPGALGGSCIRKAGRGSSECAPVSRIHNYVPVFLGHSFSLP